MQQETIVAVATPPGRGGVGILRLSGPHAYAIALQLNNNSSLIPRQAKYSTFTTSTGEVLDNGLLLYFKAPNSFTGEDIVEFQGHGSPIVLDCLMNECISLGARLARPGEFSERAFLNDKIDLAQAEAIADLIHASSQTAARMAVRSLQGDFSHQITALNEKIIYLRLFVEASIDFPEEEIDFLSDGKIMLKFKDILHTLESIRAKACQGALLREGLSVVIAGRPNAGKSTLINALAGREVAIVTEIAGTTRDVMREHVLLDDIPIHFIDTAGLHESHDLVEKEGIRRAWEELSRADCVLMVVDVNRPETSLELDEAIRKSLPPLVPIISVFNKIDELNLSPKEENNTIYLSAKTKNGLELLKKKVKDVVGYQPIEGQFLARRRHLQALDSAWQQLQQGQEQLLTHRALELFAEDLRLAHLFLCEITGEFTSDDLLGQIFSSFCIGK